MIDSRIVRLLALFALPACAAVRLPPILSDHMVLQQQAPVRLWGTAGPGEKISVDLAGHHLSTITNQQGNWTIFLPPTAPGGPYDLTVRAANQLVIHDVLIGEVWLGSGQSNMRYTMAQSAKAAPDLQFAKDPSIRIFDVLPAPSFTPAREVNGVWKICTPESLPLTSALGYYFSREIHTTRRVPVGFIVSAVDGTPIRAWTRRGLLEADPQLRWIPELWDNLIAANYAAYNEYAKQLPAYHRAVAEARSSNRPGPPFLKAPADLYDTYTPGALWNGMIAPLTRFAIRGAIWYQGEADANDRWSFPYRFILRAMIEDWRACWAQGDFPFLIVQLPNFADDNRIVLRESQASALHLHKTALAVTYDIGESKDNHPDNKRDVAARLALAARAIAYEEAIEYSGPQFRQLSREGNSLRLYFDHTGTGLESRAAPKLLGFEIAAETGDFAPAEARIDGRTVLVSSDRILEPARVRYAWANDPVATLYNRERLPAIPFQATLR